LEWNGDGTVMIERAPSGAYVEQRHGATCLALGSELMEWFLPSDPAPT
jgi:hypothetical protein